jgi:hypothetical protein
VLRAEIAALFTTEAQRPRRGWDTECIRERSHHQVVGVVRVQGALPVWEPSVPSVPLW